MGLLLLAAALLAQDDWIETPASGAPSPREMHSAVWTGREMIVWGGRDSLGPLGDGARFDPLTRSWTPLSAVGAPGPRFAHTAVWTGREMIVWGGGSGGGRYDPVTDAWSPMSATGEPSGQFDHGAVWTGVEMLIWGGLGGTQAGGRYTPATDTWAPIGLAGGPPVAMSRHSLLWTGARMIAWGGGQPGGGVYDPVADSWVLMSQVNEPAFGNYVGVWTGSEMIALGSGPSNVPAAARYDVDSNAWTPIPGASLEFQFHRAVWTGREALAWGPLVVPSAGARGGERFDPVDNVWRPMTPVVQPVNRLFFSLVWTGREAIVWGGDAQPTGPTNTGALYFPHGSGTPAVEADTGCMASVAARSTAAAALALGLALLAFRRRSRVGALLGVALAAWCASTASAQDVAPVPAEPARLEASDGFVSLAAGVWFNGFEFDVVTGSVPLRLDAGGMAVVDLRGGYVLWNGLFAQGVVEYARGDDASVISLGADLGWRFDLGAVHRTALEADVFAGALFSSLDVDESALDDFDPGLGFHVGAAVRARLDACWALEGTVEYRRLTYEWTGPGEGDDEAEAGGVALLLGLRKSF